MANLLARGLAMLADKLTVHMSVAVIYTRGRTKTVTFDAVAARPRVVGQTPGTLPRVRLDDERVDFHFAPALLDFGDGPVEPELGDRLTVGGVVREVSREGTIPFARLSDVGANMIAVSTQRV